MNNYEAVEMLNRIKIDRDAMKQRIQELEPKAESYDLIRSLIYLLAPDCFDDTSSLSSASLDYLIDNRLRELTALIDDKEYEKEAIRATTEADDFVGNMETDK